MVSWKEIPFLKLVLPLCLGIAAPLLTTTSAFYFQPIGILILYLICLGTAQLRQYRIRWLFGCFACSFLFVFGAFHQDICYSKRAFPLDERNSQAFFAGTIVEVKESYTNRMSIILKVHAMRDSLESWSPLTGRIQLYLEKKEVPVYLGIGDSLVFYASLLRIPFPLSPSNFNYAKHLKKKGVTAQAFVPKKDWLHVLRTTPSLIQRASGNQAYFAEILAKFIADPNDLAVASALILGQKDYLSPKIRDDYAKTGAIHVLAVSGLHVGIIYLFVRFLFYQIPLPGPRGKIAKAILTIGIIWSYALLSGSSPSVCRAATMFSLIAIGGAFRRHQHIWNTLFASAFLLLVVQPGFLQHLGFQLSYMALGGILFFYPLIYPLICLKNPLLDKVWRLLVVSFSAQLATFPLALYYFHQFPWLFWLSGLLVIPMAFILLNGAVCLFLLHPFFEMGSDWIGDGLNLLVRNLNGAISYLASLDQWLSQGIWVNELELICCCLSVLFIGFWLGQKNARWLIWALIFLIVFICSRASTSYRRDIQKYFIVYNDSKGLSLDIFEGRQGFYWSTDPHTSERKLKSIQEHRIRMGINKVAFFRPSSLHKNLKTRIIPVGSKWVVLPKADFTQVSRELKKGDLIIIDRYTPFSILKDIPIDLEPILILSPRLTQKQKEVWKRILSDSIVPIWDVRRQGAFIYVYD